VVSLALPMIAGQGPIASMRAPMQHFMLRDGGDYAAGRPERGGMGWADDSILVACHGTTHLDALAHVWQDGQLWNGFPAARVSSQGAAYCGIEKAGPVVTRGLFLDFAGQGPGLAPGEAITAAQLADAVRAAGLTPAPGDALLLRTGWLRQWRDGAAGVDSCPGLDAGCADWLRDSEIALVGADNIFVHDYFDYEQVERDDGTIRWAITHKPRNEKGEPTHGGPDGSLRGPLVGAWAIVRRRGHNDTWFYAEWDPYVKSGDNAWRTHPTAMIQKCAESNTLRRAFSVSGVIGEGEEPKDAVSSVTQSNSEASSEIRWPADEGLKERLKDAFDLLGYRRAKVRSLVNACRSNEDYLNLLGDLDNALTEAGLTQVDDVEVVEPDAA